MEGWQWIYKSLASPPIICLPVEEFGADCFHWTDTWYKLGRIIWFTYCVPLNVLLKVILHPSHFITVWLNTQQDNTESEQHKGTELFLQANRSKSKEESRTRCRPFAFQRSVQKSKQRDPGRKWGLVGLQTWIKYQRSEGIQCTEQRVVRPLRAIWFVCSTPTGSTHTH